MSIHELQKGDRFRVRLRDGSLSSLFVFDRIERGRALYFMTDSKLAGVPAEIPAKGCFVVREEEG